MATSGTGWGTTGQEENKRMGTGTVVVIKGGETVTRMTDQKGGGTDLLTA